MVELLLSFVQKAAILGASLSAMFGPIPNENLIRFSQRHPNWQRLVLALRISATLVVVSCAVFFGFYPAVTTARLALSTSLRERGQVERLADWFLAAQKRYDRWALEYGRSQKAAKVNSADVAGTEWPLFGSVFYLLSAQELLRSHQLALTDDLDNSLKGAAQLLADPANAAWVQKKWGERYLERENLFYRMLVILGLHSYGMMTRDQSFATLVETQAVGLAGELAKAPFHVLDDYPGECYPTDVIWATAAIARIKTLPDSLRSALSHDVMTSVAQRLSDERGLPAMLVDSRTGNILQPSRGCSISGLLNFAWELSSSTANDWYCRYANNFWLNNGWIVGFREHPVDARAQYADVDSGPILFGVGTVASAFGIGAARSAGRFDHAAPLTMETLAAAWPTPFGPLVPGVLGWAAADSWCLGETALLFALSRPNHAGGTTPFTGQAPLVVWGFVLFYAALGAGLVLREWRYWRRR